MSYRSVLLCFLTSTVAACSLIVGTDGLSQTAPGDGGAAATEEAGTDGGSLDAQGDSCPATGCVAPPLPSCDGPCLPIEVANEPDVRDIAADESGVYWTAPEAGDIKAADVDGKNARIVFNGDKAPGLLVVDATNVYWTEGNAGRVRAVRKDANAGAVAGELTGQGNVLGLAVSGSDLFFHDRTTGQLRRTTLAFGVTSLVTTHPASSGTVLRVEATADAVLLGVSGGSMNLVLSAPRGNPAPTPSPTPNTASKGVNLLDIAVDATRVYVVDGSNNTVIGVTHDGKSTVTYSSNEGEPSSVAVDATHVYWTTATDGAVKRALKTPSSGGTPAIETLATGQSAPVNVAVNSRAVYWSTSDGRVLMLRKP